MNNRERDSYYFILGLQPGASPSEIKSAFRRLVKLYHADQDQSLDAEMKYREIQTAYKALIKQATGKTGFGANYKQQTASGHQQAETGANRQGNTSSDEIPWYVKDIRDWEAEHTAYQDVPRIPFRLESLSYILKASYNELHRHIFKAALILALMSCIMPPARGVSMVRTTLIVPYINLLVLFYLISFIFLLLFRYYFIPSKWPPPKQIFAAGIYGATLVFLIVCVYTVDGLFTATPLRLRTNASIIHLIYTGILASIAAWFLIANPIPSITSTPYD